MEGDGKKIVSPYTLYANDNPGNIVTQVQLKEDNYDEWARAIRTALRAKKKFGFIDGTIVQPDEDSDELEDWWTVNSMLISWMMNTIEPMQLKTKLANCKQQGLSLMSYYAKLKRLWEELENYDAISTCKCGGCTCNVATEITKKREEEKLHQFLIGLDDAYRTVRSNILSTTPLPSAKAGIKDRSAICKYCNREGHDAEGCFQLIGYPDWWGDRPKMSGSGRGRQIGGRGRGKMSGRGRNGARVNAAQVIEESTAATEDFASPKD
ncbi:uncharacterized protein [Coffea arabica]|uniref:Retrotransposon Copia-like N-terminal domain-containing protein n=1 Tax=Coffea arabica TaxID=13443 RepID=A0ABM4VMF4_COFAR